MKGIVMDRMLGGMALSIGAAMWVWFAGAADVASLSDVDRKHVNEWMAARAESMVEAHKLDAELRQTWMDKAYTTPEIEKLRARYAELQQELARTQREIAEKVQQIPGVAAKVRQLDAARKRERELAKKIKEKVGE
jgi:septal ring factor EnvC (AmiA/AmiB activator)